MTIGGAAARSFLLLLLVVGFAVFDWNFALRVVATTSGVLFLVGYVILLALTFTAVPNPRLAPLLGVVYAALMGTWMGAISRVYEQFYDGIVGQAVFASLSVFAACLVLYVTRIVKVTRRFVARGRGGHGRYRPACTWWPGSSVSSVPIWCSCHTPPRWSSG
jgi:uncharacterized YccA/Bax inhibitor family protein